MDKKTDQLAKPFPENPDFKPPPRLNSPEDLPRDKQSKSIRTPAYSTCLPNYATRIFNRANLAYQTSDNGDFNFKAGSMAALRQRFERATRKLQGLVGRHLEGSRKSAVSVESQRINCVAGKRGKVEDSIS